MESNIPLVVMQAGIDMMGVVTSVGQLGSVKRKSDNSELSRRDVTLLDQRWGCAFNMTHTKQLWDYCV